MKVRSLRCCKNDGEVSDMTCSTFILVYYPTEKSELMILNTESGHSYLEIFHKPLEECNKMFCPPDVSRYSFL